MWRMTMPIEPKEINVQFDDGAFPMERAHALDAGYDLRTPKDFVVHAKSSATIDTGVHVQIPKGFVGFLKSKSGLNVRCDLTGSGVIDAGYTGSIKVKLYNHGEKDRFFNSGDKIIQLVILPIITPKLVQVEELDESDRGANGFGSTGA